MQLEILVVPIYEYKCRVCDERFEVEQSFTDEPLTEIDGCSIEESGRHQLKKVFAAPAISFKGDGFYRNDARSPTAASSSSSTADEKSSEKSPETSSDTSTKTSTDSGPSSGTSTGSSSSSGEKATTSPSSSSGD